MQETARTRRRQPEERSLRIAITDLLILDRYGQSVFVWKWVAESGALRGELWMNPDVDWQDPENRLTMMAATLDSSFNPLVGYPNSEGEQHYDVFRPAVLGKWLEVSYLDEGPKSDVTGIRPSPGPTLPEPYQAEEEHQPWRDMLLIWWRVPPKKEAE